MFTPLHHTMLQYSSFLKNREFAVFFSVSCLFRSIEEVFLWKSYGFSSALSRCKAFQYRSFTLKVNSQHMFLRQFSKQHFSRSTRSRFIKYPWRHCQRLSRQKLSFVTFSYSTSVTTLACNQFIKWFLWHTFSGLFVHNFFYVLQ